MLSSLIMVLLFANTVFSQTPSPQASPAPNEEGAQTGVLGLSFPIDDLGGCNNLGECTNFCEDPVNYNSCANFARENGFYQDDVTSYGDSEFWEDTQNELGCNSAESCGEICSQDEYFDRCESFARRNNIPGGYVDDPTREDYLTVAEEVLGCNSADSCLDFCSNPDNAQECTDFANRVGLRGGETTQGPGGCQTGETCSAYCSDPANYNSCANFARENGNN